MPTSGFLGSTSQQFEFDREDSGHPDKENKLKGSAPDGSASPLGNHLLASDGDHYTTQPSHADGSSHKSSPLDEIPDGESSLIHQVISPNLPVVGPAFEEAPQSTESSQTCRRGQSGGTGSHAGPLGSLPVDPTSLVSPVLSNFRLDSPGTATQPLPVDPSSLITPVISNLPQSAGNILPGGSSLPVDPSSLIDRVTSNLPVGQSTGAGNTGSPLSSLPVDTTSLINPVISNLPFDQPSHLELTFSWKWKCWISPQYLPVNPTSVVNPVVSQLPVGQLASDGNSGANSLPVDPSSLINPVISNLPIGSSGGSLLPGASSLPTDPSSLVNRVASNLPIVGNGSPTAPLNSLPADPSSLINPVISNLPVGQTDNNGNNAPGASSLPLPVADSLIGSTIPNLAGIGGNAAASNLPIPNSLTSGLPIPQLPVLQPAVEGNPGGYSSNVPSGHY
ncbi:hypothetical protein H4Q26_012836 [Puccinia striiformis f. sp. tritici PST-130]|nr:hypothetical protein H4Q26_012836 [Puccinia striiformis f. sp. tritici PST-130]